LLGSQRDELEAQLDDLLRRNLIERYPKAIRLQPAVQRVLSVELSRMRPDAVRKATLDFIPALEACIARAQEQGDVAGQRLLLPHLKRAAERALDDPNYPARKAFWFNRIAESLDRIASGDPLEKQALAIRLRFAATQLTEIVVERMELNRNNAPTPTPNALSWNPNLNLEVIKPKAPTARAKEHVSLPTLRRMLNELMPTSSEFDAFCVDYFSPLYRRYSLGMRRIDRENLLLQLTPPEELFAALRDRFPNKIVRYLNER
jgi:hypothetical protein